MFASNKFVVGNFIVDFKTILLKTYKTDVKKWYICYIKEFSVTEEHTHSSVS